MLENLSIMKGAWTAVNVCMAVKPDEVVLVVTDSRKLRIAEALAYASAMTGAQTTVSIMKPAESHGEEPPKTVRAAMKAADVVFIPTSSSLSHTDARREASKMGTRIASMPGITEDMMSIGGLTADYQKIAALTKKLVEMLEKTRMVEVTTPSGTNLTMIIEGRKSILDIGLYHKPGDWGNLPAGEACLAPIEDSAQGVLVIDHMGEIVKSPVRISVENGRAKDFVGADAFRLKGILEKADVNAFNIAELGIGTNDKARLTGNVLEDEKVLGTVHIALGDNTSFPGGRNKSKIHLDGILLNPTLKIDGKIIMENGTLKV
jgi:leucyl aminopeptidase (aminopeptidase T)